MSHGKRPSPLSHFDCADALLFESAFDIGPFVADASRKTGFVATRRHSPVSLADSHVFAR